MPYSTPATLIIAFNRPEHTRTILLAVRNARPSKLFFACDGPRLDRSGEVEKVQAVRRLVDLIDWPCELQTRFLEKNEGCGRAVSSAIEWFLNNAGEGIILEDDCLPAPSFFEYTAVMLERYRHDHRIGIISGTNMAPEVSFKNDFSFSQIVTCWGWATWRRTWEHYRLVPDLINYNEPWAKKLGVKSLRNIENSFRRIHAGDIHTWDYQLLVQQLRSAQLTVVPRYNLVLNIGFDGAGTHFNTTYQPWWAPRHFFNFMGEWSHFIPVEVCRRFDHHYLVSCHNAGGKLTRAWIKLQRLICYGRQEKRPDRCDLNLI